MSLFLQLQTSGVFQSKTRIMLVLMYLFTVNSRDDNNYHQAVSKR